MKTLTSRIVLLSLLLAPSALLAAPDLALQKSGPSSAVAGTHVVYDFYIDNNGPDPATGVNLHDVLPAGLILVDDSFNVCTVTSTVAGGANRGQQTVDCPLADIPAGGSRLLRMQVLVEPDFIVDRGVTFATNTASVTTTGEGDPTDNTDSAVPMEITAQADVGVTLLTNADAIVPAGEEFTYTIIVENAGPSTAQNIIIRDTLVASAFVSPNGCSIAVRTDGGLVDEFDCFFALATGVFNLGTFGSNWLNPRGALCDWDATNQWFDCDDTQGARDMGRIIVTINLTAKEATELVDLVVVTSDTPDPEEVNNTATVFGSFQAVADLEVQKTPGPPVNAGEVATWSIAVINHGPSAAANVRLKDWLPLGLVDGSIQIVGNIVESVPGGPVVQPVSCTLGTPGDANDPAQCDLGGLPNLWGAELTVSGIVDPAYVARHGGLPPPIGLTNDVAVSSDTLDAKFDDTNGNCGAVYPCPPVPDEPNFASATVPVSDSADLGLAKFAVGTPMAGQTMHYELQVTNLGPSVARDVTLRDFLPNGIQFLSASVDLEGAAGFDPNPCTLAAGSNALFCPLGDVPLTRNVPILIFVDVLIEPTVPDGTILTNDADVDLSDTPDPVPGNNSDSAAIVVINPTPDHFTQLFPPGTVDLTGWQVEFTPEYSAAGYTACVTAVTALDPIVGSIHHPVFFDDWSHQISTLNNKRVLIYNQKYEDMYIGSNGYVTFLTGDLAHFADLGVHFDLPRIAPFFADLDPTAGGDIWWVQTADRVIVGWEGVPSYGSATPNTFYLEMFFDGRIRWKYPSVDTILALSGLSAGSGLPDPFFESDFVEPPTSSYPLCPLIFADGFESGDTSRWSATVP